MPMGIGLWYNPRTEMVINVDQDGSGTHDSWIAKPFNSELIGLSELAREVISSTIDIDEIRMTAIRDGLVRARRYRNHVSVTFHANGNAKDVLRKIYRFVKEHYGEFSFIRLHNISTCEEIAIHLPELLQRLDADQPVLSCQVAEPETRDARMLRIIEREDRIRNAASDSLR